MSRECRHLPPPAWNPIRCPDCGALLTKPTPDVSRLLAAAKAALPVMAAGYLTPYDNLRAAIAEHEAAQPARPTQVDAL
jgi:hypothetical protein